jgi:isopenicillin N synthase-like dioxygenase
MNVASGAFSSIPLVDFSRWQRGSVSERQAFTEEVRDICHHIGFLVLQRHGIDWSLVDNVFALSERFFALPDAQKAQIDKRESRHFRGWEAVGVELTNNRPDIREQIDLWSEHTARPLDVTPSYLRLLGPNLRVPDELVPGFQATMDAWFQTLGGLADELMQVLAMGLGLAPDHFDRRFGAERMSLTKIIHYPPTPPDQFGVNAHHDAGFLTILAPGETPGLQIQNTNGDWIALEPSPETFVINLGEMLQGMSGNYFVATPHRVVARDERYSLGYFHGPSLDTTLEPVPLSPAYTQAIPDSPRHSSAGFMARKEETAAGVGDMASAHKPAVYGEQLWNYFARSYPENVAQHYSDF